MNPAGPRLAMSKTPGLSVHNDPVCGMDVAEDEAVANEVVDGTIYHFCSTGCHERFRRDPKRFAG